MSEILVTGATGFIGKAIVHRLLKDDELRRVVVTVRQDNQEWPLRVQPRLMSGMEAAADWSIALEGISVVVHCAARVHVMQESVANPLEEFRRVNVQSTLNLARQAAKVGVQRFVFISSIKVNGEETKLGRPFTADDVPAPLDAYGVSKMEAERGLREIARQTGMEIVIIRPPLVYGSGVKANFASMIRLLKCGFPLPLGAIYNQRSLVALDNLVDLILLCLTHSAAANQTFLVSDGEDISTTELLCRMGQAIERPARLVPIPVRYLQFALAILGRQDVAQRLCSSLQVDIEKTFQLLSWTPPLTLDQGLRQAADGFKL